MADTPANVEPINIPESLEMPKVGITPAIREIVNVETASVLEQGAVSDSGVDPIEVLRDLHLTVEKLLAKHEPAHIKRRFNVIPDNLQKTA